MIKPDAVLFISQFVAVILLLASLYAYGYARGVMHADDRRKQRYAGDTAAPEAWLAKTLIKRSSAHYVVWVMIAAGFILHFSGALK